MIQCNRTRAGTTGGIWRV